ncbi:MAG: homoserine dehydrogenase [Candidatus Bathyarchaeota archaeon]|nr:homoserine dehydrogenase [Candidatus Bathyarchaeota archaeon]
MTNIALIGFGAVGKSLAETIRDKHDWLKERYGLDAKLVAISGRSKGSIYDSEGLDLEELLEVFNETGNLESYPKGIKGLSSMEIITETNAQIIAEATITNIKTGEPTLSYVKAALSKGKHVVTSNKGPAALAYNELQKLALENGVQFRIESTVLSGTPAINFSTESLAGHKITSVKGIINGTTNYILAEMEQGRPYEDALVEAQRLGYAEADPTADVDGWDAVAKIMILGNVVLGGDLRSSDVERTGITGITMEDVEAAKAEEKRIKLIAEAYMEDGVVKAKVAPTWLPLSDPLANVNGTLNAITVMTDGLEEVTVIGGGAGGLGTAHGLLSDIIAIHRH